MKMKKNIISRIKYVLMFTVLVTHNCGLLIDLLTWKNLRLQLHITLAAQIVSLKHQQ